MEVPPILGAHYMEWSLYGVSAIWSVCCIGCLLYGVSAIWSDCYMECLIYGLSATWSVCYMECPQ